MEGRGKFFVRRVVIGEGVGIGTLQRLAGDFVRHRHPRVRVAAGVDFGERLDADVGVNLGGGELLVAEHFLDIADDQPGRPWRPAAFCWQPATVAGAAVVDAV